MKPILSVIVSTYRRPRALALALESIRSSLPEESLEVVVADDGSGPGTGDLVERFAGAAPFPVLHVRQEDRGFRLAAIRNRAVRSSRGEVLVFVDGDCILRPGALLCHARRCRPGRAHTGQRIFLEPGETEDLEEGRRGVEEIAGPAIRRQQWRLARLGWTDFLYRMTRLKKRPKLVAANCSVHRADFLEVNGYDERFVGWGYEDEDLARRLRRRGVRITGGGRRDCLALHLFHKVHPSHRPSSRGTANYLYFHRNRYLTRCRRGIRSRPLETLRYELLGDPPPSLRGLLDELGITGGGVSEPPAPAEVSLLFPGTKARPRGEVAVPISGEISRSGPLAVRDLLEEIL